MEPREKKYYDVIFMSTSKDIFIGQ